MRVVCIALIGKNNEPKWTYSPSQDVQDENGLRFLYHAHTALDVIEEKIAAQKKAPKHPQHRDLFLGKLFAVEECLAFGFCANSHIKQVVILEEVTVRDALVKGVRSQRALFARWSLAHFFFFARPLPTFLSSLSARFSFV